VRPAEQAAPEIRADWPVEHDVVTVDPRSALCEQWSSHTSAKLDSTHLALFGGGDLSACT
jgi:hypothetical protein